MDYQKEKECKPGEKWAVVLYDHHCTVGLGGSGYLQKVKQCPFRESSYSSASERGWQNYGKEMFRDATDEEVVAWLTESKRASVPKCDAPKLYENIVTQVQQTLDSLLKKP